MIIRSKNRLYHFDKHISDAFLRLAFLAVTLSITCCSYILSFNTELAINKIFFTSLEDEIITITAREILGTGATARSLYVAAREIMTENKAEITSFPEYAEKLSPGNQSIEMVRIKIGDALDDLQDIGYILAATSLIFIFLTIIIYGNGESSFSCLRWIYRIFNQDAVTRRLYGFVHSFSPFQRKVFEMAFAASRGNPDGSFQLNPADFASKLWPSETIPSERRKALLTTAFTEICDEYFYFQIPAGKTRILKTYSPIMPVEDKVKTETVRDLAGREITVYSAGLFRFAPPLYKEFLKHRYFTLPHQIAYAIDDRKHPYAFRIYLSLWEAMEDSNLKSSGPQNVTSYEITISLYDLLDRSCFDVGTDNQPDMLIAVHKDLDYLKETGFIKHFSVTEHGKQIDPSWHVNFELFSYDPLSNTFRMNTAGVISKQYVFELTQVNELDKIRISKRRCAYLDNFDTPCTRPAIDGSAYCRRHAKVLESDSLRIFYGKVKYLAPPSENDDSESEDKPQPVSASEATINLGMSSADDTHAQPHTESTNVPENDSGNDKIAPDRNDQPD